MATNEIKIKLESDLQSAKQSYSELQKAGAFSDKTGKIRSANIEKILKELEQIGKPTVASPERLKAFNKNLSELTRILDAAARTLTTYTDQQRKLNEELNKAQGARDKVSEQALANARKRSELRSQVMENLKERGFTFSNKKGGGTITSADTLLERFQTGDLRAKNKEGQFISGAPLKTILQNSGLFDYQKMIEENDKLQKELEETEKKVKDLEAAVLEASKELQINPLTSEIEQKNREIREDILQTRENEKQALIDNTQNIENNTAAIEQQPSALGKAFRAFTLYQVVLRSVKKALREAAATIKELDKSLTEQAMVTGLTRKQTYGLLKDYQEMASRLGTTTKEVSSTMTEFLRQGRSIQEATKLTEAAVSAARVAGISAADSINYLTTAVNGFRLSASDAMEVSDKFAAVAATAAVSYEEIATALSKVAAQANLAGMSIDYTTALLAKGIETTREAPETIGTALKTVIARMRELTDYGATLEGDTDINNVESQLAYIGIQLRNNNGELRSTEDVLNDLGAQWEQLDANQQAAIAKALAGTRQQSRLIAMMQDYERVTELQEIAAQSSGATMAQMATYMEGMEASLNKIRVAWEEIVSGLANNEVLIGLINGLGNLLKVVSSITSSTFGMIATLTTLAAIGLTIIGQKINETSIAKQQQKLSIQQQKTQLELNKILAEQVLAEQKVTLEKARQNLLELTQERIKAKEKGLDTSEIDNEIRKTELTITQLENAQLTVDTYEAQNNLLEGQMGLLSKSGNFITALLAPLGAVLSLWNLITKAIKRTRKEEKKASDQKKKDVVEETALTIPGAVASIIQKLGPAGILIGAAVAAALGGAIAGLAAAANAKNRAEKIEEASANIYNLNKRITELESSIKTFEKLDNKIVKTTKDIEDMNSALETAGDNLNEKEAEQYKKLVTMSERIQFLHQARERTNTELQEERDKQLKLFNKLNRSQQQEMLYGTSSEASMLRDALRQLKIADLNRIAGLNNTLARAGVQKILEEMDISKVRDLSSKDIEDIYNATKEGLKIIDDESKSLRERAKAYKETEKALSGNASALESFQKTYSSWKDLTDNFGKQLEFFNEKGITADQINTLNQDIIDLGYSTDETKIKIKSLFSLISQKQNIGSSIQEIFGMENYTAILNAYEKQFGTTLLNMGQKMDKFQNKINSVYEKATSWGTMSWNDRNTFMSENADTFQGKAGQALLDAFNSGNYTQIAAALASNEALQKERNLLLQNLEVQLEIERSREKINYATIQELERQQAALKDINNLYLASLELRLDQENKQLDIYKEYLQKEQDALQESLNKRKEAYEKYFEAINQEAEDQDYEQNVELLLGNLSKLAATTDASSAKTRAELESKLKDLEEERVKELRERAQEAVIQNIDDTITHMSDALDKLVNNNQLLLQSMLTSLENPGEFVAGVLSNNLRGATATQAQDYLANTFSAFGPRVSKDLMENISVEERNGDVYLTIPGQGEVNLTQEDSQKVYSVIMNLMKELGVR